jgi:hypothetical protein
MNRHNGIWYILVLIVSLLVLLLISSCQASDNLPTPSSLPTTAPRITQHFTVTAVPTFSPTPSITLTPTVPSKTPVPSDTPVPTLQPMESKLPPPPLVWASPFESPTLLRISQGDWSPTANEIVGSYSKYLSLYDEEPYSITLAVAPGFTPQLAQLNSIVIYDEPALAWSMDGSMILFSGPAAGQPNANEFSSVPWVMDRQGDNAYRAFPDGSGLRWMEIIGWMDPQTVVVTGYAGDDHLDTLIIDITNGEILGFSTFRGAVFPPNPEFVPATASYGTPYSLYILGKKPQAKTPVAVSGPLWPITLSVNLRPFPKTRLSHDDYPGQWFLDWRAGTGEMLVLQYASDEPSDHVDTGRLLIWDTHTDNIRLFFPGAVDGRFLPNGELIWTLTFGEIAKGSIIGSESTPTSDSGEDQPYLNLMKIQSKMVTLSLPVVSKLDFTKIQFQAYYTQATFSPDSRLLAMISPGNLQTDSNDIPLRAQEINIENPSLNVIDVQTTKLLAFDSCFGEAPLWSPTGEHLVYQDQQQNWRLMNLVEGKSEPLTLEGGQALSTPAWSYDGQYLSFYYQKGPGEHYTVILKIK